VSKQEVDQAKLKQLLENLPLLKQMTQKKQEQRVMPAASPLELNFRN
jgi:hypothetical protein